MPNSSRPRVSVHTAGSQDLPLCFSVSHPIISSSVQQLNYVSAENDPEGSVSIFKRTTKDNTYASVCEVGFEKFNTPARTNRLVDRGMRVGGMDFTTFAMVSRLSRFGEQSLSRLTFHGCRGYFSTFDGNASPFRKKNGRKIEGFRHIMSSSYVGIPM